MPETLESVAGFIARQPYESEVLIVENGSQDSTYEIARAFAREHTGFRVLKIDARGKGRAVQAGMLAAQGFYRFMCDADLSMPISEVNRFLPPGLDPVEVAIASREAPGAVRYNEPSYRHFVGRIYNTLIRWIALPGLQDTQCGFKCFRGDVAEDLFRRQTLMGWSFDVEVLFIARLRGYQIVELGIPWHYNPGSKVRVLRDSFHMARDLLDIRRKALLGVYDRLQVSQQ